ncbi:MAG: carbohydrate binding domain-containing protein [Candidatus Omnitrophica bacterium]|nr:carbohydrate binding domain-containing protein [Candidatus Omnitrophota bacterium]
MIPPPISSLLTVLAFFFICAPAFGSDLIPFSLPWNDDNTAAPSVLRLDHRALPAGESGFLHIENGHFVDGAGERIRFLGVNLSFSGNYPTHEQADQLAGRMAKYGVNCVRFHHTDTLRAPNGIWKEGTADKQTLDPENLDRMDYFFHALKQKGIYADINLKIGREVIAGDGFTDVNQLPTYDKGPDHYHPRMIELQKNYARDLLTHKNPYTNTRYVDEPALAIVEINNESGLVNKWAGYDLDDIPQSYIDPLQEDWNQYLKEKYESTGTLRQAWTPETHGTGQELLTGGLSDWTIQQVEQGKGAMRIVPEGPNGEDALKVDVTSTGEASWHVQLFYRGLKIRQDGFYKVRLALRAEPDRRASLGIKMDHDPWENLDDYVSVDLSREWKTCEFAFSPSQDDDQARFGITGLADALGTLWIANPSMIDSQPEGLPGGQSLEDQNIEWIPRNQFSQKAAPIRRDWIEFLVKREAQYYREMNQFLKKDLGLKAMVGGTQLSFGTVLSQMENDFIDIHGYWNHPAFPNKSWDSVDWYVNNESIIPAENNTLERLMMNRIEGRPYTCTEYNHPAPITYSSEAIPLLAAYAAFQDWDGIFFYSYSHSNNYASRSINNFFDICGHTPKMTAMPVAYNLFVRGDIAPARQTVRASMTEEEYIDTLFTRNGSLWFTPMQYLGVEGTAPYQHKTTLRIGDEAAADNPAISLSRRSMESDTGELLWRQFPASDAHVLIRSPRTKGFVGFVNETALDLGDGIQLEIGETMQNWANVLFTYLGTREDGHRWLLTATGYHENQGMEWKNEEKNSVGNRWGDGPPLVEPIPLRLTIPQENPQNPLISHMGVKIFSLNNRAEPDKDWSSAARRDNDGLVIDFMDNPPSIWYEITFSKNAIVPNSTQQ